ncbi:MAG TPA: SH3 domain-containing protein [Candidatus Ozemobacteraceae bacterium]|nr:SH3 domain-containing protein [Candidatus Ozemobacteraceae bacterium]
MKKSSLVLFLTLALVCLAPAWAQSAQDTLDGHEVNADATAVFNANSVSVGESGTAEPTGIGAAESDVRSGVVEVDPSLNVRTGPWGTIIGSLYDGNAVQIIGSDGDWYQIKWGDGTAWVHSDYVRAGASSTPAATSGSSKGVVHVDPSLNVRTGPWGSIIGSLYEGDEVTILGQEGDWYRISYNGQTAYVHSTYVSKSGSSTSPATTSAPGTSSKQQPTAGANGKMVLPVPEQLQMQVSCPAPASACGPTSLGMALAYYGKGNAGALASNLWNICGSTAAAGTNHDGLRRGAVQYGFPNAKWSYSVGLSWIREQIKAGKPVIANVTNHYVCIKGVDDSGNIYYNDPWGGGVVNHVKSFDEFSAWWNGGGCWHAAMVLE